MHQVSKVIAFACFSLVGGALTAAALEPSAPERLISPQEAAVISVRRQASDHRAPAKPTQAQQGEAIDWAGMEDYYGSGIEGLIWVGAEGLNDKARAVAQEMAKAHEWGLDPSAFIIPANELERPQTGLTAAEQIDLEIKMSLAVLKYARHARGGRMDPKDLSLDIDRAPPLMSGRDVLGGIASASDVGAFLRGLHPQHEQFQKLRLAYLSELKKESDRALEGTTEEAQPAKEGKTRKKSRDRTAVRRSQRILYNMEMWRWMPAELGELYVQPNVPEYRIRVVKNGKIIHSERMIVGKVKNKTPIFSDELETVVFHPYWGVPNSIKVKELLPKLARGGTLEKQGLRMRLGSRDVDPRSVDWSRNDIRNFHVYQPPGSTNALGIVKFLFPNSHAVYFHDTPTKQLFNQGTRAFSHGCMRVRDPLKLAEVLFREDRGWGMSKIKSIVDTGPEDNQITLNRKIPVHISYFTARVDEDGELKFVDDVYGHEKLIQIGFNGKAHTIVKENRSLEKYVRVEPQVANNSSWGGGSWGSWGAGGSSGSGGSGDTAWKRRVWGNN